MMLVGNIPVDGEDASEYMPSCLSPQQIYDLYICS